MPATPPPPLKELAKYPNMTSWFRPDVLAKLLWRVIVSDLFGAIRRPPPDRRCVWTRSPIRNSSIAPSNLRPARATTEVWTFTPDSDGAIWIDFVADLGDGFDATYAIASLLAQDTLTIGGHVTRRGQILVMGGDEVYPNAAPETYRRQLRDPYDWAFPDPASRARTRDRRSTRFPATTTGTMGSSCSWRCSAARSTFIWVDGGRISGGAILRFRFPRSGGSGRSTRNSTMTSTSLRRTTLRRSRAACPSDTNIILVRSGTWLALHAQAEQQITCVINEVGWVALARNKGLRIPLVLSGDTHHYSRYTGDDGVTQFITSGGGGAFLHPTHQLAHRHRSRPRAGRVSWLDGRVKRLSLGIDPHPAPGTQPKEARYPTREESLAMLRGNFKFVARNPGFAVLLGFFYWLLGLLAVHLWWDGFFVTLLAFFIGFWTYTKRQEGGSLKVLALSAMNAIVHSVAVILLALLFRHPNAISISRLGRGSRFCSLPPK